MRVLRGWRDRGCVKGLITVGCMAVMASAQPDAPLSSRQLSRDYMRAHQAKDWKTAIEIGLKWTSLKPKDNGAAYNLACAYALSGDTGNAIKWLQKSIDTGMDDARLIRQDTDLDSIRDTPGYAAALAIAEEREQAENERFLTRVENSKPLVYLPPGYDASAPPPLIIALHGYGSNVQDIADAWKGAAAQAGAILVAPRAVHGVISGGAHWGTVEQTELIVEAAVKHVGAEHAYDSSRVILTGFSQGGYMTFNLAARNPERYRGAIPMAGRYDPRLCALKSLKPSASPRFYIMVGDQDRVVEQDRDAARDLEGAGIGVQLAVFPGIGHEFPGDHVTELGKAVRFVLDAK